MEFLFEKIRDDDGENWRAQFEKRRSAYHAWFLSEGINARPTYLAGVRALKQHMPELLPTYERLCELAGGDDLDARFLSFYQPPHYMSGCSQAVWLGDRPMLVRNYDYDPKLFDGLLLDGKWNDRRVLAISDGMWGVVDGMNDDGLVVSLTFGGRRIVGDGFGIPLILRYILEFCGDVAQAQEALKQIPCHMAYNVTMVDKSGDYITAYLSPDREIIFSSTRVATNHQKAVEWHRHAQATATVERERFLLHRLTQHDEPADKFAGAFLKPPLYSTNFDKSFGTLYTAIYHPTALTMDICWPGVCWPHKLGEGSYESRVIRYPQNTQPSAEITSA